MRALTIPSLMLGLVVSLAWIANPSAAADSASFVKKPKAMGSMVSTVSGFRAKKQDGSGFFMNCSGRCANGRTLHWQCQVMPEDIQMHCGLRCNPPPAKGLCFPE